METFRKIIKGIIIAVVIVCLGIFSFLYFANYSTGYRAGVPIKVSKKGNIIKTFEGEMNIGGLTTSADGVIPTSWSFSVRKSDRDVLDKLEKAIEEGRRVKLFYKEKYVRFFWLGDSKYFVYEVETIQ